MSEEWIIKESVGNVGVLKLNRGTINAFDLEFAGLLTDALAQMRADETLRALLLTSANDKFFSNGFELPTLLELPEPDFRAFYQTFSQLALDLYTFPKPTIASLTGHAIAGGCILALCCDYRTIAEGRTLIGLNEIKLGLPVPFVADRILRDLVGSRGARDVMAAGDFYTPEDAEKLGLVDRVIAADQIRAASIAWAETLAAKPAAAYRQIKSNRTGPILAEIEERMHREEAALLECWYSETAQGLLREAAEKF